MSLSAGARRNARGNSLRLVALSPRSMFTSPSIPSACASRVRFPVPCRSSCSGDRVVGLLVSGRQFEPDAGPAPLLGSSGRVGQRIGLGRGADGVPPGAGRRNRQAATRAQSAEAAAAGASADLHQREPGTAALGQARAVLHFAGELTAGRVDVVAARAPHRGHDAGIGEDAARTSGCGRRASAPAPSRGRG